MPARLMRLVLVVALAVVASACQMRAQVGIDVHEDGSGTVRVAIGLDAQAVDLLGGADGLRARKELRVDDLTATGWTVTGPTAERDGLTWIEATKPFATPAQATKVLTEVAGGPLREFHLERRRSFARTEFEFGGTVDFTKGLESFSDDELAAALDGKPLGEDVEAIEKRWGDIDRVAQIKIAVRLPGAVSSNAPGKADNGAVWQPRLSEKTSVALHAESHTWHKATLALLAIGVLAGLALVMFAVVLLADRARRRGRGRAAFPRQ